MAQTGEKADLHGKITLKDRFAAGGLMGMIGFIGSPMAIEILAHGGVDYVVLDMEHCPMDMDRLAHLVRAADAVGLGCLVRVPEVDAGLIKRILNLDVDGIVIPHGTKTSCEAAVRAARYAPEGERGACPIVRATGYWPADWAAHVQATNRKIMVVPLIEDRAAIDDVEGIAAIPGVDGVFVGPYDLSVSVGAPGADFDHPAMRDALDRVVRACHAHGKLVVTSVGDRQEREYGRSLLERGVHSLVLATDALVLLQACRRLVGAVR